MEKAHNVYMLCVDFGWADLGSWGSLFDLANKDENENAVLKNNEAMLYECSGNVIALNNPKRLAVIQGLKDCIVAESGNVLLICKKDDEQRIKQFVADAKIKYGKEYNELSASGIHSQFSIFNFLARYRTGYHAAKKPIVNTVTKTVIISTVTTRTG